MSDLIPPVGVTPLGLAELDPAKPLPPPPVIRADKIRYQDQSFASVFTDADPIDAAVVEALWRVRFSGGAVLDKGTRYLDVKKLDEQARVLIESDTRRTLARIVSKGYITIRRITVVVEPAENWAEVTVNYVNNRTSQLDRQREARRQLPEENGR